MVERVDEVKSMNNLTKKAQEMQTKISNLQEKFEKKEIESFSEDGVVKVIVNGRQQVLDICIDKESLDIADVEKLESLIKTTVNQALDKSREIFSHAMSDITGIF